MQGKFVEMKLYVLIVIEMDTCTLIRRKPVHFAINSSLSRADAYKEPTNGQSELFFSLFQLIHSGGKPV